MKTVERLLKKSIDTELCCHCGTCAGVCPVGAITVNRNSLVVSPEKCVDCGLCTRVCPAEGYVLSDITCEDIKDIPKFSACSTENDTSENASSGGFVTQTLLSLLESGDITAAAVVVTGENLTEPSAKYIVTSNQEEILAARRSKYTQASIDKVLDHIKNHDGRYAIVGLPCQLYAVSKAMEQVAILRKRIVYKIGMVCGYTYEESCIDGLLKVLHTGREETESIIGWREGGLPGNFSVKLKNGKTLSMPFADEHSVDVTYFAQNRCLLCKDCLCEYGDVVCADIGGWAKRKTLVMVRTVTGQRLLDQFQACGHLLAEPCDIPYEKTVLPFMLREKRAKVDIRIHKYKKADRPVTCFVGGYTPKLLLAQKIEMTQSIQLQEFARKNRDAHSREKMLKIGHTSYHKLSEKFILKVLFKLQVWMNAFSSKVSRLFKKIAEKLLGIFPTVTFLKGSKPLKVAVIGLGRWGSQYLPLLKKSPKFKVVAAYDNNRQKLELYSKRYGFGTADNIENLIVDYGAEAVFVLTPTPTHAEVFAEISEYHLPVYMEKPIAGTPLESAKIVDIANQENILLYVGHSMKFEPAIQRIRELLDAGVLGFVTDVRIVRTVKSRNDTYYPNAALYQIGVHLLDVLLYLLGGDMVCDHLCRNTRDNVDEVTFTRENTNISLRYGFCSLYNFSLYLAGENGHILLADGVLKTIINGKETVCQIPMKNEKTICSQLDEFYCAVIRGEPFLNTKENAERIISLCEQITKTGESV